MREDMSKNRRKSHNKIRPTELRQIHMSQSNNSYIKKHTNNVDDVFTDDIDEVFIGDAVRSSYHHPRNNSHMGHLGRKMSQGYRHTRDQLRRMKYVNKQKEAEQSKLFIYNVSKRYTIDDIYHHFTEQDVKVLDLWQSSHTDARRRSFVILVPHLEIEFVKKDEVLESLGRGVYSSKIFFNFPP